MVGAADGNDWVKGGVEFQVDNPQQAGSANLHWHVSLVQVGIEQNVPNQYVSSISTDVIYARTDYMNNIKAQVSARARARARPRRRASSQSTSRARPNQAYYPNCVRGPPLGPGPNGEQQLGQNFWCGLNVKNFNTAMDATYGLLIFAAILSFVAWVFIQSISGGNIAILSNPNAFKITGGLMIASCFFTFVAVLNFDGAGIKPVFCSVFDPSTGGPSTDSSCER
jgi:hypothetical protein